MRLLIVQLILSAVLLISCKKGNDLHPKAAPEKVYENEFLPCLCDSVTRKEGVLTTGDYIRADVNGIPVCADLKGGFTDAFDNMLQWGFLTRDTGLQYYDNLHMIRFTKDKKWMLGIFMENTHALTKSFPYALPRANPEFCEIGEIQFINQEYLHTNNGLLNSQNDRHYMGMFFGNGCKLIVERFENSVFEGTFSGLVWTGSNRAARITNGKFRMSLTQLRKDIDVR
jgi:hypothetical protein